MKRVEVDYYTQPLGGTDVHHIDHRLREKPFGTGKAYWGEVTAYFRNCGLREDPLLHPRRDLAARAGPAHLQLETMALWIVPPEALMRAGAHGRASTPTAACAASATPRA